VYMLWMYQRVIFGPVQNEENAKLVDLSRREVAIFVPLLALMLFMGLYPQPLLTRMEKSVEATLKRVTVLRQASPEQSRRAQYERFPNRPPLDSPVILSLSKDDTELKH